MSKLLLALDCPYNNSVNVYFLGETTGESKDPRCNEVEQAYIGWLDDRGCEDLTDEERINRMSWLVGWMMPDVNDVSIRVHHVAP